jgi:hypothetical protein
MRNIFLLAIIIILSSCTVKKKFTSDAVRDSIVIVKDSIRVEIREVVRDTTILLPADSSMVRALLECDSLGQVRIKEISELRAGLKSTPKIKIIDNYIELECKVDSQQIYLYWQDRYENRQSFSDKSENVNSSLTVKEKIIKKKLPWWIYLAGGIIAILILWRLYKKFKPF